MIHQFPIVPKTEGDTNAWPPVFRGVPLTDYEKRVYGEDAQRCAYTGFIFERGHGALSLEAQTANFKANLLNPDWCLLYLRSDPHAQDRHPKLYEHYKSRLDAL
jgi:hypothetical protein